MAEVASFLELTAEAVSADPLGDVRPKPPMASEEPHEIDRGIERTREKELWLRRVIDENFAFVWRNLRRLGIHTADIDDAVQQVFIVAERRRQDIQPGKERAFLFGVALKLAQTKKRSAARSREDASDGVEEAFDTRASPEEMLDQLRARALLERILLALQLEVRAVFVLCEFEEHTVQEAAKLLEIPAGTAASRLARARRQFASAVDRAADDFRKSGGAG
jgi:RNA polymerase sigma-70 factor (ECF subfamily)